MKIALIIFTRNELENSQEIYSRIPFKAVDSTYVVDGNSTDGTREFWRSKGIGVFGQKRKGVGGAYDSAFKNTSEDALIFFHPDGNMDPNDINKFVYHLKKGQRFIVASRMIRGGQNEEDGAILRYRKWASNLMALFINFIWGNKINRTSDLTQGYRAITRHTYNILGINIPSAVAPDTEQIIRAFKNNVKITEFPTKERVRMHGKTSMGSFRTSLENIKVFLIELLK